MIEVIELSASGIRKNSDVSKRQTFMSNTEIADTLHALRLNQLSDLNLDPAGGGGGN